MVTTRPIVMFLALIGILAISLPTEAMLPRDVLESIERVASGKASAGDDALIFMHNDNINRARLNGYISDHHYQSAQRRFSDINQRIAGRAATEAGAGFTVQKTTSKTFAAGTDSDYIMQVKSRDPVGQVKKIQGRYNDLANEFLEKNLPKGTPFRRRANWHNKLDVDFMADPKFVNDKQFRQIAELNNDAYTRRGAAEYERLSRMGADADIKPGMYRDYGQEMQDFIEKKQAKLAKYRKNPALLKGPHAAADFHRMMAQEQKYIERIESANARLRRQAGLKPKFVPDRGPFYETHINKNGKLVIRKRNPSVAKLGARRSPAHLVPTSNASAVAKNSLNRAIGELSESMAQAHALDPKKWSTVADDIADLTRGMPPAQKGMLIERIKRARGADFAKKVAASMRTRVKPSRLAQLKNSLKKALSADDVANLRAMREALGKTKAQAIKALAKIGVGLELYNTASGLKTYFENIDKAMDPNITDAEADKYFEKAHEASMFIAQSGAMGALFEAVPPAGAAYIAWMVGYDGTTYILHNTETGMWVNRHVERYAKRFDDARHRASEALTEMFGGESLRTRSEAELRRLEQTYWKALKDGRIRLKPGVSTIQLAELLRAGRLLDARDLIERTDAPKPGPSEAGAEVWRLAGRPEIYISPAVDNWRPGMTVRYTVENSVSASSLTHRSKYLVADKKTGARRPNKSIDRVHIATVSVGSLPALLIADNPVQMTLSASIKQVMGRGKRSIEGAVSGTGIAVTSDSKFKNKVWASSGKQEQMTVTYTLSVTRSSSNIKKLVVHSPGVGKLTWTYHAAIGVSADDALEQLSREEKKRGR